MYQIMIQNLSKNRSKINQESIKNRSKNRSKINQKSIQKSIKNRSKIDQKSIQNRSKIDPKIDPKSMSYEGPSGSRKSEDLSSKMAVFEKPVLVSEREARLDFAQP